jgi:predicted PurR-regulated permease PerM
MSSPRVTNPRGALLETGKRAWALIGILLVIGIAVFVLARFSVVLLAFSLALFPAALLSPLAEELRRRGMPGVLISLTLILGLFGVLALIVLLVVPRFSAEAPALMRSLREAVIDLEQLLAEGGLPIEIPELASLQESAFEGAGGADGLVTSGLGVVVGLVHLVTGTLIALVSLFFLLKDGSAIWRGITDLVPARGRADVEAAGAQVWWTFGSYFRGQLLVALFDAVFIGLGLLVLGIPLALPLAVLVFVGGLFPIVGAFVSGLIAVLVALADQGLTKALLVLLLIVVVQQVESNVLEPLILSKVIALHPLAVVLAVSGGALAFGIVGAFLAVPLWAATARVVDHLRGRRPPAGPAAERLTASETAH